MRDARNEMRVPGRESQDTRYLKSRITYPASRIPNPESRITQGLRESDYNGKPLLFKMLIEGKDGVNP